MLTYGNVRYTGKNWIIACEPHVRARLKRVFPRAPQHAADEIRISASTENTRELRWFLQRYPMECDQTDMLEALANEHAAQEIRLADLLSARAEPRPIKLAVPPREYQTLVPSILDVKGGLLLADDVGLGKTCSAICAMSGDALPALVVCPAHMPRQWAAQLKRFAPDLKVHIIRKGQPYDLIKKPRGLQRDMWPDQIPDVLITSYHKLRGWAETLAPLVRYVVFDECQQLRSPDTQIYVSATHVSKAAKLRLGLSATPIYNYGSEFFWVTDALLPGALGERAEFVREWCSNDGGDKARIADTAQFGAYLRREGIMLRRTRADVGRELPELQKIPHTIEADTNVLNELKGNAVELAKIVLRHNEQFRGEKMQAAGEFDMLMRQATGIAKAPYVAEFVRLLVENGEKVVLFGWHRAVYDIWVERLKDLNPALYTGTESANQKHASIADFVEGNSKVLVMSLRSGAGVDGLQGICRTVVFGELDWSPGVHEQCVGRVYRDGQGDPVAAYFLISDEGADPIMAEVLGVKREQIEGVRNPDSALAERIDTGEHHLRRLAREFLQRRNIATEATATVMEIHA